MTQVAAAARRGSSARRPEIPSVAWRRAVGLPCPERGRPRVTVPLIDDGEWAGIPLGGLGTGSIGPTYRGDVARWHLEVGRHAFQPIPADGFSLFVGSETSGSTARVLSTLRPTELPAWGWGLPIGAGTYHALFPRAWWTFEPESVGVRVVGEQLSPVIAGDYDASATPVGVVEWWVENPTDAPLTVGLMLTWRNPLGARPGDRAPAGPSQQAFADDEAAGVVFRDGGVGPTGLRGTFAIAAARGDAVELSVRPRFDAIADTELWADFAADGRLDAIDLDGGGPVVAPRGQALGGAVAATTTLEPGESRSVRFAIAWDLPVVEFGSGRRWWKRYTRDWGRSGERAWDLAGHALKNAEGWRAAIERWQSPVLADPARPDWYKAALFNELYYLVDGGSFWEAGEVNGPEPDRDDPGRFALMESFDYPFYDSVDVDFYASAAILELFPALERRGIRDLLGTVAGGDADVVEIEATGARAVRKLPGVVPHDIGGPDEDPFLRPNRYKFQDSNRWLDLAPKLALQVWRDVTRNDDAALAAEARPSVEAVLRRVAAHDTDGDGLLDHAGIPDQTYDTWPMHGPSAYVGILWLGALRAAEELALTTGDAEAAAGWRRDYDRGKAALERLWRGSYFAFDGGGPTADSIMADQLAGQWYADVAGLGDLVEGDWIVTALRTIHERNVLGFRGGRLGPVNGMQPNGLVDRSSEQSQEVWVGSAYALAALMIGRGLTEEGWRTAAGPAHVTYDRGLWFRTPEAYDEQGDYRPSLYVRPLAIWAIEEALRRAQARD